jgi:hypothetical protein
MLPLHVGAVGAGETVVEGHPLAFVEQSTVDVEARATAATVDLDRIRPDLREVRERHAVGLDASRPDAVARRRKTAQRTARENIEELCDPETFVEYGPLVIAAQRRRRSVEDLIQRTPADGLVAGIGNVNGQLFKPSRTQCVRWSARRDPFRPTRRDMRHTGPRRKAGQVARCDGPSENGK